MTAHALIAQRALFIFPVAIGRLLFCGHSFLVARIDAHLVADLKAGGIQVMAPCRNFLHLAGDSEFCIEQASVGRSSEGSFLE
jgi:hypothetical protein